MKIYSTVQKQILQKLLAKYESSKTYKGENSVAQKFSIKPSDVFKDYEKDSADINQIEDFEKQCTNLESENFIQLDKKYERITKITAESSDENWNKIRMILGVKDKKTRQQEEISFYSKYFKNPSTHQIVKDFCKIQTERLEKGKDAEFAQEEARAIVELLTFILKNKNEILERELSISVLADSKKWENYYRSKVLRILRKSGYFDDLIENCTDEKEENKVILEELNVYANPSYVYFKGNGKITFQNGNDISITPEIPLALSSACIKEIADFEITDTKIMTVENLTSFNRIKETGTFYIFLSGYHNSAKQNFIKKIHSQNPEKEYLHFGDIDPDGFYILQNLRTKTNINFKPYKMGITQLEKYSSFAKPLEQNDQKKARALKEKNLFPEIIDCMLKANQKLEQEIISWKEM